MSVETQLLHGTLEGCILKVISQQETYGYEIANQLEILGLGDMKEGTIYPLLLRLEKKGLITSEFKPSPLGPSRKYYSITLTGEQYLSEFTNSWRKIAKSIDHILDLRSDENG